MEQPLVSIICTAYQHEMYIKEALECFLAQETDFPIEVIVHDDASADRTAEIIKEYQKRAPDIIKPILQKENQFSRYPGKITRIVNEAAQGKYIALCEGDDHWTDTTKLQKQVDLLNANPDVGGCFHYTEQKYEEEVKGNGRVFGYHEGRTRFTVDDTLSAYALCHNAAFMYRKEALILPDWYGKVASGDMVFFSVVAGWGDLLCIHKVMSVYRKNPGGVTNEMARNPIGMHKSRIKLLTELDKLHRYKHSNKVEQVKRIHIDEINRELHKAHALETGFSHRLIRKLKRFVSGRLSAGI